MEEKNEMMEQLILAQEMDNSDANPNMQEAAPSEEIGDFASSSELLKAYQNLRVSFTQKAQELSQLKRTIAQGSASVANENQPASMDKQAVIEEYLANIQSGKATPHVIGAGANFLASAKGGARGMKEATMLAKDYFSRGK